MTELNRKDHHLRLANQQYQAQSHADFTETRFVHHSLPQLSVGEIDVSTQVAGLSLTRPFYINAMTGGSEHASEVNRKLAILARETGLMLASGSVSTALSAPEWEDSFRVLRQENPNGLILANLGAHHALENAQRAIDLLQADGLQYHLNAPQELAMPEGDRDFSTWSQQIETVVRGVQVPVIVKEVGFGMSRETIAYLADLGVSTVDVSGRGGTDFAKIENDRRSQGIYQGLNQWGQSTVVSLVEAMSLPEEKRPQILASGGIKSALDIVISLALGADAVGLSAHFLHWIERAGLEATIEEVHRLTEEIRFLMTALGCKDLSQLRETDLVLASGVRDWCQARGIDWQGYARRSQHSNRFRGLNPS